MTQTQTIQTPATARTALLNHWPEYAIEAALLAVFMISACVFSVLLEHPGSPMHRAIDDPLLRRALAGVAMGGTLIALVYSRCGQRSGAHMNPSVTLTFLSLGKIQPWDAAFYVAAQFIGGLAGVFVSELLLGSPLAHSAINYAVTVPGPSGEGIAFLGEALVSFLMMSVVLSVSNATSTARFTGLFAGALLAMFITFEAPLSGVSLNPARTLASAAAAGEWSAIWLYFIAPPSAMLLAGQAYRVRRGVHRVFCAKLHHARGHHCIFDCNYGAIDVTQ